MGAFIRFIIRYIINIITSILRQNVALLAWIEKKCSWSYTAGVLGVPTRLWFPSKHLILFSNVIMILFVSHHIIIELRIWTFIWFKTTKNASIPCTYTFWINIALYFKPCYVTDSHSLIRILVSCATRTSRWNNIDRDVKHKQFWT